MNIAEKISRIFTEIGLLENPVLLHEDLFQEVMASADSLAFMTFVVSLENEFNIELPEEILFMENLSLNNLVSAISSNSVNLQLR